MFVKEPSKTVFQEWVSKYGGVIRSYADYRYDVRFPTEPKARGFAHKVDAAYPGSVISSRHGDVQVEF